MFAMPRKRSAFRLENLCLTRICKSMEKYWYRPFEEQFGNTSLMHVIGPFDNISSELIQKVIDVLVENKLFNPKYLQLLFSNHLNQLDLSKANTSIRQNSIAETIGIRCINLTKLCLRHCSGLSNKSLVTMVTHLKKLQHLNLASTKSDNQVLAAIGKNCQDLLTLDVACTRIQTLQPLLLEPNRPTGSLPCPKLRCVDFYLLMLPQEQVVDFLKERAHILTDFIFDHMTETIDNLTYSETACSFSDLTLQNGSENDIQEKLSKSEQFSTQSLKIRTLNCNLYQYSPENVRCLHATVLTCPDITTVTLINVSNGSHLLPLKNLSNLCRLSVNLCEDCCDDGLLHYDTGIKPVLEKQGNKIISLELHGFAVVDIKSTGVFCPNIKRIDLFQARLAPLDDSVNEDGQIFRKMEEFIYHLSEDEEVDQDEEVSPMSFVLEHARALRSLKLTKCAELNDSVMSKAIEEHSFINLEVLQLSVCNCITSDSIESLLFTDNSLKEVKLDNCWGIHNSDFQRCKSFIKKNNLDVNLVWV